MCFDPELLILPLILEHLSMNFPGDQGEKCTTPNLLDWAGLNCIGLPSSRAKFKLISYSMYDIV